MSRHSPAVRALGVDAAGKHGWVGVVLEAGTFAGARLGSLREMVEWADPDATGVDIPVGHVPSGLRRADVEARRYVGPRRASVFATPPAGVLDAASFADANAVLGELGLPRMSRQAWSLVPRMAKAAELCAADDRIFEVHPEVSFRVMAGEYLRWSKKSWNGLLLRRRLLADAGIELPDVLGELDSAVPDDVLDAAAAAWSAQRIAGGIARSLPDPPELSGGRRVAIWY